MEAAWREHVGQLTLAQLSSSEACQKHLNEFELQLVSTALGQTVIGSVDDIQEKIASVLRCHPHPDAKSMTRLSSIHQSAYNAAIVDEILKDAKKRSEQGFVSTEQMTLKTLKAYKPFMLEVPKVGIHVILTTLKAYGYHVQEANFDEKMFPWAPGSYGYLEYRITISWE